MRSFTLLIAVLALGAPMAAIAQVPDDYVDPSLPAAPKLESEDVRNTGSLAQLENEVHNAKIGIGVSAGVIVLGGAITLIGGAQNLQGWDDSPSIGGSGNQPGKDAVIAGSAIMITGAVSMIATGILLGVRKKRLRERQHAYSTGRQGVSFDPRMTGFAF